MKIKGLFALLALSIFLFSSCTKINEATELGDDLIPAVDNVKTFETSLDVQAAYNPFSDSTRNYLNETMAVGKTTDPVFGTTTADMYFQLSSPVYGSHPFKDTVTNIDSVVPSLSYVAGYGDTASTASPINIQVSEILPNNGFKDDSLYRFDQPGFSTGVVLGSATFTIPSLKDSIRIGLKTDTTKVGRVLRIRLNNSLADKLKSFDTTSGVNGGYKNDSLFRNLFRGLAVKTANASLPGALAYFNVAGTTNSALIVYYRSKSGNTRDTATATYVHGTYTAQANSIRRSSSGEYAAKFGQTASQKFYIQSSPTGSYVGIKIPGLDTFSNKVIHRAELIAYSVPADNPAFDNVFSPPYRLWLDHKGNTIVKDSAYIFDNDIETGSDGSLNYAAFGGTLRSDNSYRFTLTRYVQGIVTRKERNDSLRLFAPLRSNVYSKTLAQVITVPNLDYVAKGRVVIAGSTYPDPTKRLRLRIIYSNL